MKHIGRILTPYGTKFGAPKQGGMALSDESRIRLRDEFGMETLKGLEPGAYVWVFWDFHQCEGKAKPMVRPPKLGGNAKMGVFATRSPFRPNNMGMSLLKFEGAEVRKGAVELKVSGADMVSGTPILDIKPYHPTADIPWSDYPKPWFLEEENAKLKVVFEANVEEEKIKKLIEEILSLDPRPAYHDDEQRVYSMRIAGKEIFWKAERDVIRVIKTENADD